MLKIYGAYKSRASRNYWMAGELGIEFESIDVIQAYRLEDPLAEDARLNTHSPAFRKISPAGTIPVIDDDGVVMGESIAINFYLASKHRGPLSAGSLSEEAEILYWSFLAVTEIEPNSIQIVRVYDQGLADSPAGQETLAVVSRLLRKPFALLDAQLADRPYLVGNRFTVADLNVAEIVRYAMTEKALTDPNPHLLAWYERCHARPAFQAMWERRAQES